MEWAYRFIFLFFVLTLEESLGFWHGVDVGQIGRKQKAGFLSLVLVVSALIDDVQCERSGQLNMTRTSQFRVSRFVPATSTKAMNILLRLIRIIYRKDV